MKRVLLNLAFFGTALSAISQVTPVNYRGAFEPAPATAWTAEWANFTPAATDYPGTNTDIAGQTSITSDTKWTKDKVYNLQGYVYVRGGATLTIEAGTVIRSSAKSALVITRTGKIFAEGTPSAPIVFTSNKPIGQRAKGDWGGVVLIGNATHNNPLGTSAAVEGDLSESYGGSNDDDSSGVFRYVRIEYPGQALSTADNSEINGLTFYAVGRKTVVDHIQVSYSGDDAFEWFGGTVNVKHLVAYKSLDDDFDTDNGFRGIVQFGVAHRDPNAADASGSNGFESDNDKDGTLRTPITAPEFHNMTIVGPKGYAASPNANFKRAAHIRRNSACSIHNSIIIGFTDAGLLLDGRRTVANAATGLLKFTHNYLANNGTDFKLAAASDTFGVTSSSDVQTWALLNTNANELGTDAAGGLANPFSLNASVDWRPTEPNGLTDQATVEAQQMVLFPNPATNNAEIALSKGFSNGIVSIQNTLGTVVASQVVSDNTARFDLSSLSNGMYIVSARNGNKVVSKTLLINR